MRDDFDQFFEEEEELAREQEAAEPSSAKQQKNSRTQPGTRGSQPSQKSQASQTSQPTPTVITTNEGYKPPSLVWVIIIAIVALLLGMCIGYFIAMALVDADDSSATETAAVEQDAAVGSEADALANELAADQTATEESSEGLISTHPDVTGMLNEDGTVNEEAVAEYRAQRDAEQESATADQESVSDGTEADETAADDVTDSEVDQ